MNPEFPNVEYELNEFAKRIIESAIGVGIKSDSDVLQSIEVKRTDEPHNTIYEVLMNEYWYYLAYGRGPSKNGSSPGRLKDIVREWIRSSNIKAEQRDGKTPTEEELIFLITRKLHRDGFQGRDFVTEIVEEFEARLDEAWNKDLDEIVKNLI